MHTKITIYLKSLVLILVFCLESSSLFAQTRNPSPESYNPYATITNGRREKVRLGTGRRNEILRNSTIYDGRGRRLGVARAGLLGDNSDGRSRGGYNAGAMIQIKINGTPRNAVLCWNIPTTDGGRRTGFVLTRDLRHRSIIESRMREVKRNLARVRPNDRNKRSTTYLIRTVRSPFPDDSYTFPNQTTAQNRIRFYYLNNGTINLLVDLPYRGSNGLRVGKAIDMASPGRTFRRLDDVAPATRKVFARGSRRVIGEVQFVYGFVFTDTGERVYCWINRDCISLPGSFSKASIKEENTSVLNIDTEEETIRDFVYPNPTNNGQVSLKTNSNIESIMVYDETGRNLSSEYKITENEVTIYSNHKGMTFVHVSYSDKESTVHKVIWN